MYYRLKLLLKSCSFFSTIHIFSRTYDYVDSMKISLQSKPRYSCKLYSYSKKVRTSFCFKYKCFDQKSRALEGKKQLIFLQINHFLLFQVHVVTQK